MYLKIALLVRSRKKFEKNNINIKIMNNSQKIRLLTIHIAILRNVQYILSNKKTN